MPLCFKKLCFRDIWGEVKPIDGFLKIQELWLCFKGLLFTAGQVECMPRFVITGVIGIPGSRSLARTRLRFQTRSHWSARNFVFARAGQNSSLVAVS